MPRKSPDRPLTPDEFRHLAPEQKLAHLTHEFKRLQKQETKTATPTPPTAPRSRTSRKRKAQR